MSVAETLSRECAEELRDTCSSACGSLVLSTHLGDLFGGNETSRDDRSWKRNSRTSRTPRLRRSLPFVITHPDVFADLPLTFDSLHKTVDALVTEPFLRNFIDTMCIFCGFPAKGAFDGVRFRNSGRFF